MESVDPQRPRAVVQAGRVTEVTARPGGQCVRLFDAADLATVRHAITVAGTYELAPDPAARGVERVIRVLGEGPRAVRVKTDLVLTPLDDRVMLLGPAADVSWFTRNILIKN